MKPVTRSDCCAKINTDFNDFLFEIHLKLATCAGLVITLVSVCFTLEVEEVPHLAHDMDILIVMFHLLRGHAPL